LDNVPITVEQLSALLTQEAPASDRTYIAALKKRWYKTALLAKFIPMLGIMRPSSFVLPKITNIHPHEFWRVELVNQDTLYRFTVPKIALEKLTCAFDLGLPIECLVYAKQCVTPPKVEYRQEIIYVQKEVEFEPDRDPLILALVKCRDDIGIPYLVHGWKHE
jgi:hypothetical protein